MKPLKAYYRVCEQLKDEFVFRYFFPKEDFHWIGDEIGGVLSVGDIFIDMHTISEVFRLNMTGDQFHDWYWWQLDFKNLPLNIENYLIVYRKDKKILDFKSAQKIRKGFEKIDKEQTKKIDVMFKDF